MLQSALAVMEIFSVVASGETVMASGFTVMVISEFGFDGSSELEPEQEQALAAKADNNTA